MQNHPEVLRPSLRCGCVLVTQEADGYSVRCGSDPDLVSLGRYPEFRDAVEIPLLLERSEATRTDLTRLQRVARDLRWDWPAVTAALDDRLPPGSIPQVA